INAGSDLPAVTLESAIFFGSDFSANNFHHWTISNLIFKNFDVAVIADHWSGSSTAMEGFKFLNNEVHIPADLNITEAPADTYQNIGLHLNYGHNQEIKNNKFIIDGTGISDGTNYSRTVAIQSATGGPSLYDGLTIQDNIIEVTG